MAFFPCYPLNEPAERSQNRSRFTMEVMKQSYEVPSNSSQTLATTTLYFNPEDFNEGSFGEYQSARYDDLAIIAGSAYLESILNMAGSAGGIGG